MALEDTFGGDTLHLVDCIDALVELSDKGAITPHGLGGHARTLLSAAGVRLLASIQGEPDSVRHGIIQSRISAKDQTNAGS